MKGCFIFILLLATAMWLVNLFYKPDAAFEYRVSLQANPFYASRDSADIIWARAVRFLALHKAIIAAGKPQIHDSLIVVPYASSYQKGNSIRIERMLRGDSVRYFCEWWDSREISQSGGKEIALYMQQGIWRYDKEK